MNPTFLIQDTSKGEDSCAEGKKWTSVVEIVDNVTGIKSIDFVNFRDYEHELTKPEIQDRLTMIGTFQDHRVSVVGSCCNPRIDINVSDIAGNHATCEIFANSAPSHFHRKMTFFNIVLSLYTLWSSCYWEWKLESFWCIHND